MAAYATGSVLPGCCLDASMLGSMSTSLRHVHDAPVSKSCHHPTEPQPLTTSIKEPTGRRLVIRDLPIKVLGLMKGR